jgi:DNA-binding transcriptional LysR family regulator
MHLTHEGQLFLSQCLKLKYELDSTRELISGFHSEPKGKLKISCNPMLAETFLLPKLIKYKERFPKVALDILIEERMPDIKYEKIDLVFGVNWPAPDEIIARKIRNTRYVLCASPEYIKKYGTPESIKDLKQHFYIPPTVGVIIKHR